MLLMVMIWGRGVDEKGSRLHCMVELQAGGDRS